jgi:hypothetical protein
MKNTVPTATGFASRFMNLQVLKTRRVSKTPTFRLWQEQDSFWKQMVAPDGAIQTALSLRLRVINLRIEPSRILGVYLLAPRLMMNDVIERYVAAETPAGNAVAPLLPQNIAAAVHVKYVVRRAIGKPGQLLPMHLSIVDHNGCANCYRFRLIPA